MNNDIYDEKPWLQFYDDGVAPEVDFPDVSYAELFSEAVKSDPHMPAFHFMGVTVTYSELGELTKSFTVYLQKNGCDPGDVAKMDEDGFFYIADRVKDMLIVGGYKVFSREVEEILYQHPTVEFCAIVGVPNEKRPGNDIVKLVAQRSNQTQETNPEALKEDIIAYCRKNMAPYKVPKIVEFIDQIPLTAVGKVDKKALR